MSDHRTVKTNNNNLNNNNQTSDSEYLKLKSELMLLYPIQEKAISSIEEQVQFDMGFHKITAQQILLEMEAFVFSNNLEPISLEEKRIKEILLDCLGKLINKSDNQRARRRPQNNRNLPNNDSNRNNPNQNINLNLNNLDAFDTNDIPQSENSINYITSSKKEIVFENYFTLVDRPNSQSLKYNSREISYSFFSNFEIKEYSILPKDEESYLEEYKNYFKMAKGVFMDSLKIDSDDPLMDADKFILLVTFENTEGKPLITDIVLVDPLQDYKKFFLKIENQSCLNDYYFFSGQLIYVEGLVKNNDIFAQKIIYGMPILEYGISENYVKDFFQESAPYLIYAVNGPILNKSDIDLGLFVETMKKIAADEPHALILSGPILNIENSAINSGEFRFPNNTDENSSNYFEIFEFFLEKLNEIFAVNQN